MSQSSRPLVGEQEVHPSVGASERLLEEAPEPPRSGAEEEVNRRAGWNVFASDEEIITAAAILLVEGLSVRDARRLVSMLCTGRAGEVALEVHELLNAPEET